MLVRYSLGMLAGGFPKGNVSQIGQAYVDLNS